MRIALAAHAHPHSVRISGCRAAVADPRPASLRPVSEVVPADEQAAARALAVLRDGGLVGAPSDTTYALLADAFSSTATQRMMGAKRRSRTVPLTVLIRSPRQTTGLVEAIAEPAERLMSSYWPGPLTLVFAAADGLGWDLGDARGTVALRIPADDLLLNLVAEIGPLASTTANRRGEAVPTTAAQALRQLSTAVDLYVDGDERRGPASTIVDVSRGVAHVLREGAITTEDVRLVAEGLVAWGAVPTEEDRAAARAAAEPEQPGEAARAAAEPEQSGGASAHRPTEA